MHPNCSAPKTSVFRVNSTFSIFKIRSSNASSTSNLLDIMSKLNENEKITFIFSTHDQRVIDRARRVITLEDGKIVSDTKK